MPCCNNSRALLCALGLAVLAAGMLPAADAPQPAVPVVHASLDAAYEAAASDHSLVLIVFGADWCLPCQLLESNTLSAPGLLSSPYFR